jgi:hypothetical protein
VSQVGELRICRRPQARTSSCWLEATRNFWSPWRGRPCGARNRRGAAVYSCAVCALFVQNENQILRQQLFPGRMRALRLRTVRAWRQRDQQRDPARLKMLAACLLLLFLAFHSLTSLLLFYRPEDLFIESAPAVRYQPHPEPASLLAGRRNQSISSPIDEYDGKGSNLASNFSLQDLSPAVRERPMHKRFSGSRVSPWAPRAEVTCHLFTFATCGCILQRCEPKIYSSECHLRAASSPHRPCRRSLAEVSRDAYAPLQIRFCRAPGRADFALGWDSGWCA